MADFDTAIAVILRHEGGWVNDPADPGGATNYGISLRWLKTVQPDADVATIRNLTPAKARDLYKRYWWDNGPYGAIVVQNVATKIFDMAVNMGQKQATLITQRALKDCGFSVVDDGVFGPKTLDAVNTAPTLQLLGKLVSEQSDFYTRLAVSKPSLAKFLHAWLHRAAWPLGSGEEAA